MIGQENIFIIAEAGVNHNGSLATAKELVDAACEAGADCVKFQTYVTGEDTAVYAEQAGYQQANTGDKQKTQYEMLRELELSFGDFTVLERYCRKKGILFLSSPFDLCSLSFLERLGQPFWKVASSEVTNYPFLKKIAATGRDIVLSTGMCGEEDIEAALGVLNCCGQRQIVLLQCNTQYPTPYEDVNLLAMRGLKERFGCETGFSDHTQGIEIPIAAAALGARIIEKHFTLDRSMAGPDHAASLEPRELKEMVRAIRHVEAALGSGEKKITESERPNLTAARKSIVASRDIHKGEAFTEDNLAAKRPGGGVSPMLWESVLGRAAGRDYKKDEQIEHADLSTAGS